MILGLEYLLRQVHLVLVLILCDQEPLNLVRNKTSNYHPRHTDFEMPLTKTLPAANDDLIHFPI